CTAALFAGGIDNKTNLNSGFLRNPSRNSEHKRPEAVIYNIAGTGFMDEGLTFNVGNQFIFKKYTHESAGTEYKDEKPVFLFPDAEIVYKKDNWAAFLGFGVFAGGGSLEYKDGTAVTAGVLAALGSPKHSLDVYSVTMGEILGGTYVLNDNISLSGAVRFLHATQNMKLSCSNATWQNPAVNGGKDVEYDAKGYGFGGIFGINAKDVFVDGLVLAAQYQTITKMSMEFKSTTGNKAAQLGIVEGKKFKNDLPAVLGLGAGYYVNDDIYVSTSFNYYFNKQATMQNPMGGTDMEYNDSWEIGLGADWQVLPQLGLSAGTMYSKQGTKDDVNSAFSPVLDSLVTGFGVEYKVTKQIMLTGSYMHCRYFEKDYGAMKLNKDIHLAALGVTVKPF
ncbi:MAG: outer membrane protein transport protein, partial [Treponema sp.]|nr:outer membrane protein transport protein [Treponema sp.]